MTGQSSPRDFSYDKNYYDHYCGELPYDQEHAVWRTHFRTVAEEIVDRYKPKRTLDVGCAKGFLVEHLRALGVEAFGTDISKYAISQVSEAARPYCREALATEPIRERFDLVTFIEVAEHMDEEEAKRAVANICGCTEQVLFSSSPSDFKEASHFNVHAREYWLSLFAEQGFFPTLHRKPTFVTEQAILFKKLVRPIRVAVFSNEPAKYAVVRLRLLSPLQTLERKGKAQLYFVCKDDPVLDIERLLATDLIVIHREFANRKLSDSIVGAAKCLGIPVVFEIDDLLTQVPATNPNHLHCASLVLDFGQILRAADFVTASTPRLAEELAALEPGAAPKTHVLPNCLDPELWGYEAPKAKVLPIGPLVIGWMGTATHGDDLAIAAPAIEYVLRKYRGKVVFRCWGYIPESLASLEGAALARGPEPNIQKHAADLRACGVDVAIAPLTAVSFNHAKSNLKWLEYALCGIPGTFSKVVPYETSILDGHTGLLVENTTEAWVAALERMIREPELRARVAKSAHAVVSQEYRLDKKADRWDSLYRSFIVSGTVDMQTRRAGVTDADRAEALSLLLVDQANRFFGKGLVDAASVAMEEALAFDRKLAARFVAAADRLSAQHNDRAAGRLLETLASNPDDNGDACLALAQHHESMGDPLAAEAALREGTRRADPAGKLGFTLARFLGRHRRAEESRTAWTTAIARCEDPASLVEASNELVLLGHAQDGLRALRRATELCPGEPELARLLVELTEKVGVLPRAPRTPRGQGSNPNDRRIPTIGVFAGVPLSSGRVVRRVTAPLRALASAGKVRFAFGNATANVGIAKTSDCLLVTAEFAAKAGEAGAWLAQHGAARTPVVLDVDTLDPIANDPSGAAAEAFESWVERAAQVIVGHAETRDALESQVSAARGKVALVPDVSDLVYWPWRPAAAPTAPNAPLTVGYVSPGNESQRSLEILEALAASFDKTSGQAAIRWWGPIPVAFQHHVSILGGGHSAASHREHVRALANAPIDFAIVPEAGAAGERAWLDFATCHVACVVSCAAASPTIRHGETAVVAGDTPQAWIQTIAAFATETGVRAEIAQGAWLEVVTKRSIQQNVGLWLELFQMAKAGEPALTAAALDARD
jgi:glycosyltransferase involved in cell wall biosynthesis/predicted TPR repeat methyltransferase